MILVLTLTASTVQHSEARTSSDPRLKMCLAGNSAFVTKTNRLMLKGNLILVTSCRLVGGGGGGGNDDDYLQDHTKLNKLTGKNSKVLAVYT